MKACDCWILISRINNRVCGFSDCHRVFVDPARHRDRCPATSGLNFNPGDVVADAVTVALPTAGPDAGKISFFYGDGAQPAGATLHVVADIGATSNRVAFDGTNIWVTNSNTNAVTKIVPF